LGISPTEYTLQRSSWSAPIVALGLMKQITVLTFQGLGNALAALFTGHTAKASAQVAGPVGIFVVIKDGSFLGYQFILLIIGVISLTLAIMNLLPIPALDGGRLYIMLASRAVKRPLSPKMEEMINGVGFAALMILFVLITIVDVKRFF
jgi:regulator of sigma E protease